MAGHDVDRYRRIGRWPVRELLLAYIALARDRARRDYQMACLIWASQVQLYSKPTKPPRLPAILKDDNVDT